jgi:hypothetical protein
MSGENVFTLLRCPMSDSWGEYHPSRRLILLADDVPAEEARTVVHRLLTDQDCTPMGGPGPD